MTVGRYGRMRARGAEAPPEGGGAVRYVGRSLPQVHKRARETRNDCFTAQNIFCAEQRLAAVGTIDSCRLGLRIDDPHQPGSGA